MEGAGGRAHDGLRWSEPERDVLRLVAQGRTNGEVAEALGIELDEAKARVSALAARLGAGSREEVADYWRRHERAPARAQRWLRGLVAVPLWKLGADAGAVAAAGAGVGLLLTALSDDSSAPKADPGVWVAVVRAGTQAAQHTERYLASQVEVFDVVSGQRRVFGDSLAFYPTIAFSPDGSRLAAVGVDVFTGEGDSLTATLHLWTPSGDSLAEVRLEGVPALTQTLAWSPDGTRLAAIGERGIAIFDPEGRELGRASATPLIDGGGFTFRRAADYWSPDSQYVFLYSNGLFLVVDRDGAGRELDPPAALLDPATANAVTSGPVRWEGPGRIGIVTVDSALGPFEGAREYVGRVSGLSIDWADPVRFDWKSLLMDQQTREQMIALAPGFQPGGSQPTADGSAEVFVMRQQIPEPFDRAATLVIRVHDDTAVVELGRPAVPSHRVMPFDVVVVPGWAGKLPARFDASTPVPPIGSGRRPANATEFPSGTPPPEPTMTFASPEPRLTPVPYPSPRGETIQPQVQGLPAYRGAEEIDGFTKEFNGVQAAVQMFATTDSEQQVVEFYKSGLEAMCLRATRGC
jgi:DNA-binding CsgD family transcriptional regulator